MEIYTCPEGQHVRRARRNPSSEADSALWECANCSAYVCLECGKTEVSGPCLICDPCARAEIAINKSFEQADDDQAKYIEG